MLTNKTILLIPCYNEAKRLDLDKYEKFLREETAGRHVLYFINDGSSDNTGGLLRGFCDRFPGQALLLNLPKNIGKGPALRQGFLKALELEPKFLGYIDADLSAPLRVMINLQKILESSNYFLAMGSRVLMMGHNIQRNNIRHYIGRIYATLFSVALRLPTYDTQCGAKLFRNTKDLQIIMERPFISRWLFDVEIITRIACINKEHIYKTGQEFIYEYPLDEWINVSGSKVNFLDGLAALWDILRISIEYRVKNK